MEVSTLIDPCDQRSAGTPPELTPRPAIRPEASGSPDAGTAGSSAASGATGLAVNSAAAPQTPPAAVTSQPPAQDPEIQAVQQAQPRSSGSATATSGASAATAQQLPADSAASPEAGTTSGSSARLAGLWVYPIKSAAPIAARSWPLGPNGLALDREWALVNPNGGALRQGRHPRLATIQPRIDFDAGEFPDTTLCARSSLELLLGSTDLTRQSVTAAGDTLPSCTLSRELYFCVLQGTWR